MSNKQSTSLQDRLASFARQAEGEALRLPQGMNREKLWKNARKAETAFRLDRWVAARDGQSVFRTQLESGDSHDAA